MLKQKFLRWWPMILVGSIAAGLYACTLTADFLRWDDRQNILLNPWIEHNTLSMIWTYRYYNMYIPVTYTFWDALWHIAPNSPLQFHLANILLHALNTILVYVLARRILRHDEKAGAIFAALIFAVHPLQVESVAWISTGRDLLAAFFSLLATYILMTRTTWKWMLATFALFSLACFSKPSVAIVPVAVGLIVWWKDVFTRERIVGLASWFAPAVAATLITKHIQQLDADLRLTPMGLGDRLLVAIDSLGFYTQKFFVPFPLAADYGRTREMALADNVWIYGLVALGIWSALFYFLRKRISSRYFLFTCLFVLLLLPILGVVPYQAQAQTTVSDRYAYFSLIALGLLFGSLLGKNRWVAITLGTAVIVANCVITFDRAQVWATNELFFTDMLAKNDKSHVALSSLGVEYILTNRLPLAEQMLNRAVQLRPVDVIPRTNLAQLYLLLNRPDKVVSEIAPLLDDKEFLRVNQTETRALASAFRLSARASWGMDLWSKANDFYCRWYRLDYENEEGKAEIQRFAQDARKHSAPLKDCNFN